MPTIPSQLLLLLSQLLLLPSQLLLLPSNTQWVGLLLCLNSKPTNVPLPSPPTLWLVSSFPMLLVQSGYADQDVFRASWQGFLPSFPSQVQRKTEEGDLRSCWDQSCAPWPQGPECEADGTQTLIQDSLSCLALLTLHLDISVYSFKNTFVLTSWKPKYTESFSRDVLPPSERGWEGEEFGQLTDVWKKSYQKAQSFWVFAC